MNRSIAWCIVASLAVGCHKPAHGTGDLDAHAAVHDAAADQVDAPLDAVHAPIDAGAPHDAGIADAGPRPRRVTLVGTGDITISPRLLQIAMDRRGDGRLLYVLGRAGTLINAHDIAYADLETPLSTHFRTPGSTSLEFLGAPPEFARDLARTGLDVVSVATNHAYDQTAGGLDETLRALDGAGVQAVGAGTSDEIAYGPRIVQRDDVRVAFLAFTVRTNDGPGDNPSGIRVARMEDPARALAAVAAAREQADIVVVGAHWGRDFSPSVSDSQRQLARRFVDAGADVVFGSGPHMLQRVERTTSARGDALIAYSLGNFVSNEGFRYRAGRTRPITPSTIMLDDPRTRDGIMLRVVLEAPSTGVVHLVAVSGNALWTHNVDEDVRELPLRAADESIRNERLAAVSAALGPVVHVRP